MLNDTFSHEEAYQHDLAANFHLTYPFHNPIVTGCPGISCGSRWLSWMQVRLVIRRLLFRPQLGRQSHWVDWAVKPQHKQTDISFLFFHKTIHVGYSLDVQLPVNTHIIIMLLLRRIKICLDGKKKKEQN